MQKVKKSVLRREKIKAVALEMFLTKGYEETSLKDIIKVSGGSFSDIYNTFENKQGLFAGIIGELLEKQHQKCIEDLDKNLPLKEFLYAFSRHFINLLAEKETFVLYKIIHSQAYSTANKNLVEYFRKNNEKAPFQMLSSYFRTCKNPLRDNADKYAKVFSHMLQGENQYRAFFDMSPMSEKEREEHIKFVIEFFLKAI